MFKKQWTIVLKHPRNRLCVSSRSNEGLQADQLTDEFWKLPPEHVHGRDVILQHLGASFGVNLGKDSNGLPLDASI